MRDKRKDYQKDMITTDVLYQDCHRPSFTLAEQDISLYKSEAFFSINENNLDSKSSFFV